nr:transposase [Pyrinomonadaceae bacterium]
MQKKSYSMAENEKKVSSSEQVVRAIRRQTRRMFSADEKIRIALDGLPGEGSIADLCRREGIHPNQYYTWSKEFLEAGKRRLKGDTERPATRGEVDELRSENGRLSRNTRPTTMPPALIKALSSRLPFRSPGNRAATS